MPARLFRCIKKTFSSSPKAVLLPLVFLLLFLTKTAPAFADISSNYATYLNLFDGTNFTTTINGQNQTFPQSGVFDPGAGDLFQDATTKTVTGLKINIGLGFNSTDSGVITSKWNNILDDTGFVDKINGGANNDTFLIRVCDKNNLSNCWLNTIPYSNTDSNVNFINNKDNSGNWRVSIGIENFPILYSTTVTNPNNGAPVSSTNGVQYIYTRNIANNKDEGIVSSFPSNGIKLSQPSSVEVSMWYCGRNPNIKGQADGSQAYQTVGSNNDTIATFGSLCGGNSYFRIGSPITITIPATTAAVAAQVNTQQATTGSTTTKGNLPECGIDGLPGDTGTISGCIAQVAFGFYWLTAWIAGLFGSLFDFFIGYSVSSASYGYGFVATGWKLVRDISNIFFIIIMVWTGFSAVFDTSKTSMKNVVPALIVNALLINFSLFFTRVVIDLSNVTARIFYSEMIVCKQTDLVQGVCPAAKAQTGLGGYWPLSEKIISSFNPQNMFTPSVLNPQTNNTTGTNESTAQQAGNSVVIPTAMQSAIYFGVISLIAAALMIAIAIMFFKVTFLFLGRVVGLYICMIFSPFAFLSRSIPMLSKVPRLKWTDWTSELSSLAMMAPIFVFFLYIIYTLLSSNFVQQIGVQALTSSGFFAKVMSIAIPMGIIYFLMDAARKTAESLSGEIGKSIQKYGEVVTGLAVGAATGGTALLGSRVVGGLAKRVDESRVGSGIRDMAAKGGVAGFTGRVLQRSLNNTRSGSFDVRQTTAGSKLFGALGINANQKALNVLSGVGLGLGVDQRRGGREADVKRRQEREAANAKLLEEKSGDQINVYNKKQRDHYNKKLDETLDSAMVDKLMVTNGVSRQDAQAIVTAEKSDTNQTAYNDRKRKAIEDPSIQTAVAAIPPPKQIASADDLTRARRKIYTDQLKKGGAITQSLDWMAKQGKGGAQLSELLSATVGAAVGSEVRSEGSRKAAKKIAEKSKVEKDLLDIEATLKQGFRDLIAQDTFGKKYNTLSTSEQSVIDAKHTVINANETEKNRWSQRIQVIEKAKYPDPKKLNAELKTKQKEYETAQAAAIANNTPILQAAAQNKLNEYFSKLDEITEANKHRKIWDDIAKYQEEQKKKLKDEEKK